MSKLLKIGITGGIGSGKSYVCRIFEGLGYKIYYADQQAKSLMYTDVQLVGEVKELLGEKAYTLDGQLDRAYVGSIVFNDPEKLKGLNALVHPAVGRDFYRWYAEIPKNYPHAFVLKEAAIMYESGSYKDADAIITVYAPKSVRLQRVLEREEITEEAVLARMAQQWPESEKMKRADYTIFNDGKQHLLPQIREIIRKYSQLDQGKTTPE